VLFLVKLKTDLLGSGTTFDTYPRKAFAFGIESHWLPKAPALGVP
jgi:hypothetical protein